MSTGEADQEDLATDESAGNLAANASMPLN